MNTSFPTSNNHFLKAENFQDREMLLTFRGWEKKSNEDDPPERKKRRSWKDKLDFVLRYSYPEWAKDKAGEPLLGQDGTPLRNRYYDAKFPRGYSITYFFEEGQYESGSKPLFEAFCICAPKPGEKILIKRTGKDKETKWYVARATLTPHPFDVPEIQIAPNELQPDEDLPF